MLETLWRDARNGSRSLRRSPAFTCAALLMLAMGIGASTSAFTVVYSVLVKPLPYRDPDALVNVVHTVNGADLAYFSDRVYLAYADNNQTFERSASGPPAARRSLDTAHRSRCARSS